MTSRRTLGWLFIAGSLVWFVGAFVISPVQIVTALVWFAIGLWWACGLDERLFRHLNRDDTNEE